MKQADLSAVRRKLPVKVDDYPGAHALVPPPTPRRISLPGIDNEVALALEALGAVKALTLKTPQSLFYNAHA